MAPHTASQATRSVASSLGQVWVRLQPVRRRVRARLTIDTRALAVLRITLGLILLMDLLHRSNHLALFYTDSGVYPVSAFELTYTHYNDFSIHALSGALWFQQLLFVVAGLFALALVVGYRTRLVGVVSLALLFSLHARNPMLLNGGDRLLRVLLLVALVAPLGERWSIDALRRGSARERVASVGTAALLVQPVVVFTSNAILKHRGDNWYAGDALEIAMLNDVMSVHLAHVLVDYPALLTLLNYAWIGLLSGSVLFLLLTAGRLRALAALAYMGAFAGMVVTMAVGLFPFVLIASVIPFLTAPFWDALAERVPARFRDRLPTAAQLGPLGRPPVERRLLSLVRARGHRRVAAWAVGAARSVLVVAGAAVLVWIVLFSASEVTGNDVPEPIDHDHLDQQDWGLYAPDPSEAYSWYPVEAELANGSTFDALDGGQLTFDRPPDVDEEYATFRHRKYMQQVRDSGKEDTTNIIAKRYADWICQQANETRDGWVEWVTVYRMYQPSPIDGEFEEPRQLIVIDHYCFVTRPGSTDWGSFNDSESSPNATLPPASLQADPSVPVPDEPSELQPGDVPLFTPEKLDVAVCERLLCER
jgi:hypothetical protein